MPTEEELCVVCGEGFEDDPTDRLDDPEIGVGHVACLDEYWLKREQDSHNT